MNESAPAPVRPPVPAWERVAAGVLVGGWVAWAILPGTGLESWLSRTRFRDINIAWQDFLSAPHASPLTLIDSYSVVNGAKSACGLVVWVVLPVVIGLAWVVALGYPRVKWREGIWCLVLAHGMAAIFEALLQIRAVYVTPGLQPIPGTDPGWHPVYWIKRLWINLERALQYPAALVFAQVLLAALVLGFGWWRRRRALAAIAPPPPEPPEPPQPEPPLPSSSSGVSSAGSRGGAAGAGA